MRYRLGRRILVRRLFYCYLECAMAINAQIIKALPFFRDLPEGIAIDLAAVCVPRTIPEREIIYLRGGANKRVFLILSGGVELYHASPDNRIAVNVFKEGDFFGDLTFVNHPMSFASEEQAQAVFETELCVMTTEDIMRSLEKNPALALALLGLFRERLHQAESKIKDLAISSASTRMLNELVRYVIRRADAKGGFYEIKEKLTHQLLSEMSGLARETVTKTLGALEGHGFISYTPERHLRLNIKKIVNECAGCVQLASEGRPS